MRRDNKIKVNVYRVKRVSIEIILNVTLHFNISEKFKSLKV